VEAEKYHDALMKLIEQKIEAGAKGLPVPKRAGKAPSKVVDLASILQNSLDQAKKGRQETKTHRARPTRKRAA